MLHMSIQVWRRHPAFPAQWLYGLYEFALATGFLATIIIGNFRFRQLDASTGTSGPHDFALRFCHARQSQHQRPPLPAPTSATMAYAPLVGQDGASCAADLPDGASGIFLHEGLDRLLVICPSG